VLEIIASEAAYLVARTTLEQSLPELVEDDTTLVAIAAVLRRVEETPRVNRRADWARHESAVAAERTAIEREVDAA
jgi:hypothetical protein